MGRRRNEKHVFTADEIGTSFELTWLGWSHDPMFKPKRWLMFISSSLLLPTVLSQ